MNEIGPVVKLFAYYRVSTDMQKEKETYKLQERAIQDWVRESGKIQVVESFKDFGKSGLDGKRPAFNEMLRRLDEVEGIAVWDWDRLTRDWELGNTLIFVLGKKCKMIYMAKSREILDMSKNVEKLIMNIKGFVANQEVDNIRARIKAGIKEFKVKNGYWGRKEKCIDWKEYEKYVEMKLPKRSIAKLLNVSPTLLYEKLREHFQLLIQRGLVKEIVNKRLGITRDLVNRWGFASSIKEIM